MEGEGLTGLCDITAQSVSVQINRFLFSLVHCVIETVDARYYVRKRKTRKETATSMACMPLVEMGAKVWHFVHTHRMSHRRPSTKISRCPLQSIIHLFPRVPISRFLPHSVFISSFFQISLFLCSNYLLLCSMFHIPISKFLTLTFPDLTLPNRGAHIVVRFATIVATDIRIGSLEGTTAINKTGRDLLWALRR